MIRRLTEANMQEIMDVESRAFLPPIQTREEIIRKRLKQNHPYLGVEVNGELVGTLALRFAQFSPDFEDFCKRNPTFDDYAEKDNEDNANAVFVYSIGVVPEHRNSINAKKLLKGAEEIGVERCLDFLIGDARMPSYNGSNNNLAYEQFDKNEKFHRAIDTYLETGILPSREVFEKDPVAGFYMRVFPKGQVLGVTDENFWKGDEPCGGHMVIEYLELEK